MRGHAFATSQLGDLPRALLDDTNAYRARRLRTLLVLVKQLVGEIARGESQLRAVRLGAEVVRVHKLGGRAHFVFGKFQLHRPELAKAVDQIARAWAGLQSRRRTHRHHLGRALQRAAEHHLFGGCAMRGRCDAEGRNQQKQCACKKSSHERGANRHRQASGLSAALCQRVTTPYARVPTSSVCPWYLRITSIAACNLFAKSGSLLERAPSIPKRAFSAKLMRVVSVAISTG